MGRVYAQLTLEERRKIERWRHAKVPVNEMARYCSVTARPFSAISGATISKVPVCPRS